ncbi:hypothetical protein MTR_0040s0150 [Medicago truncatula]|uniref:Uncharacterized protein n=1 Tax=Medicago truncatula TaxID=3880 RepID=A0A072TU99_MEDTR|nr:hypothetical protein MTR_0040s0150 [Medicago truncatula]
MLLEDSKSKQQQYYDPHSHPKPCQIPCPNSYPNPFPNPMPEFIPESTPSTQQELQEAVTVTTGGDSLLNLLAMPHAPLLD